uniref:secondary thiamine-phosphate synthase enzyme YjbQ n=2 Tax=Thiolapillus sp. TaxID=2017437 RepID=UPI003AF7F538
MAYQEQLDLLTAGRGTYNITKDVQKVVAASNVITGLCHVFVKHTSASLILCENADPTVRSDLERFMINLVPDGSPLFRHIDEGDDDMPAHIRSILTNMDLTLPVNHRRCQPWRAKRRLVDPSSREAALFSRRALRQRENNVGLRTRR